jgi:RNA polymerase sigma-70 factor (ECF subfamily)
MISADCLLSHMDSLYRYAMVLSRNAASASDLVQETYVRALSSRNRLQHDRNIRGWLFTILRNAWLNQVRRTRSSPELRDGDPGEILYRAPARSGGDPHTLLERKVEADQVREAVQRLPESFREIILLREYEDLSYQEIADALGCPVGTVMSRLARARSRLRTILHELQAERER